MWHITMIKNRIQNVFAKNMSDLSTFMFLSLWSGEDGEKHQGHGIITIGLIERQRKLEGNRQNIQKKQDETTSECPEEREVILWVDLLLEQSGMVKRSGLGWCVCLSTRCFEKKQKSDHQLEALTVITVSKMSQRVRRHWKRMYWSWWGQMERRHLTVQPQPVTQHQYLALRDTLMAWQQR